MSMQEMARLYGWERLNGFIDLENCSEESRERTLSIADTEIMKAAAALRMYGKGVKE